MTLQEAIEKHFFEIFECIQVRTNHTKLPILDFWLDYNQHIQDNTVEIVGGYKFTFKVGTQMNFKRNEIYSTDVFMEKL